MIHVVSGVRAFRAVSFLVVGVLAGTTAGSALFGAPSADAATTYIRSVSCTGLNFHPVDSKTGYGYYGTGLMRTTDEGYDGSGMFACDPGLPNKAIVTKVQFTLFDTNAGGAVESCGLYRNGLEVAAATSSQAVATVTSTGVDAFPGFVRRTTTTISNATIDNSRYAYWLQCRISTHPYYDYELRIHGANVIYKISSPANG